MLDWSAELEMDAAYGHNVNARGTTWCRSWAVVTSPVKINHCLRGKNKEQEVFTADVRGSNASF